MALSSHDVAIWRTIDANRALDTNSLQMLPHDWPPFPPSHRGGARAGARSFVLAAHTAVGDGTYERDNGWFVATGGVGLIQWMVDSDWAELMFTLWCRDRYPEHPQFTGFTWIPGGWADRLKAEGLVPPPHPSLYRPPLGS